MIKEVNVILDKSSPAHLITGLEALVGVFRDVNEANNIDVELFFKEPAKLITKFKRMDSHGLKYKNIQKHKASLEAVLPEFTKNVPNPPKSADGRMNYNLNPFLPMIQWGVKFCTAAEIELKKEDLEKAIKKLNDESADAKLLINRND